MKRIFLNDVDSLQWLFSTHLQPFSDIPHGSAVLCGNEDAPELIEVYARKCPFVTDEPLRFALSPQGNIVRLEGRFERVYAVQSKRAVQELSFDEALRLVEGSYRTLCNLLQHDQGTLPIPGQPGRYIRFVWSPQ